MNAMLWIAIAAGGAIGATARYAVSRTAAHFLGTYFPWGTLTANVTGSFIMGIVVMWLSKHQPYDATVRAFLTIGVLGAFTTFSTFSLDVVMLYRDRSLMIAGGYLVASVLLSLGGLIAGLAFGRQII